MKPKTTQGYDVGLDRCRSWDMLVRYNFTKMLPVVGRGSWVFLVLCVRLATIIVFRRDILHLDSTRKIFFTSCLLMFQDLMKVLSCFPDTPNSGWDYSLSMLCLTSKAYWHVVPKRGRRYTVREEQNPSCWKANHVRPGHRVANYVCIYTNGNHYDNQNHHLSCVGVAQDVYIGGDEQREVINYLLELGWLVYNILFHVKMCIENNVVPIWCVSRFSSRYVK